MIASLVNLRCSAGHGHYAPPRELFDWIGKDCNAGAHMTKNGVASPGRCKHALAPLQPRLPRNRGKVATVDGLTTTRQGDDADRAD